MEIAELFFVAGSINREQKNNYLNKASIKFDLLKFFIQICWETNLLNNKKYIALSGHLDETGKMLGGWKKSLEKKTSALEAEKK